MIQLPIIDEEETITVIKSFIKTYVENSDVDSVVIGVSGGIDSAIAAVLCAEALGKDRTYCLFLPDHVTPMQDRKDFDKIINTYHLSYDKHDISDLVQSFNNYSPVKIDKLTGGNIKARVRMILLYAYANKKKSLVCGTSNKSELLIGYYTKYGDGGVDFMPLGDIYKTDLFRIARYLKFPDSILSKPPTAGLWKGQTDENELKLKYDKLDLILYGLECKLEYKRIALNCDVSINDVVRIANMRKRSQHKRRSPLIPKIGLRTPGLDWRSPVQEG
jgi:NAD+ synthase